jgi:hypothetical protein
MRPKIEGANSPTAAIDERSLNMNTRMTLDSQPEGMVRTLYQVRLDGYEWMREVAYVLPVDYPNRIIGLCECVGLEQYGRMLSASLRDTMTIRHTRNQSFGLVDMAALLLLMTNKLIEDMYPAEKLVAIAAVAPWLWKCLVEDQFVQEQTSDSFGDPDYWYQHLYQCVELQRRLRNAAQN